MFPQKNLWNSTSLIPPKFEFFESYEAYRISVKQAIANEYSANKYRDLLFLEMISLSRYLDRRRNKYRSDKGFKTIEKIEKSVNRIYHLDLKSTTTLIKLNLSGTFVPSKQLCQWLLIKFQSHGKLLKRVIDCCTYSCKMLNHRLKTGHNWIEIMMAMAMVSRIWALSSYLMTITCKSYEKLRSVINDVPLHTSEKIWLPDEYNFPDVLENWIQQNESSYLVPSSEYKTSSKVTMSNIQRNKTRRVIKAIKRIKSSKDLKQFIVREHKRRVASDVKSISNNLDALQWHMFTKQMRKWMRKLQTTDNDTESLLRKIRQKLRIWLI